MSVRLLLSIVFICATVAFNGALAATIVVTTTADTGSGSLRAALFQASSNAGPDDIVFQIPGPGEAGVHYIRPATPLPRLNGAQSGSIYRGDFTRLLGESQRAFGGDTNPVGPEIVLDGTNAGQNATGLVFWAASCLIREITVQASSSRGRTIRSKVVTSGPGRTGHSQTWGTAPPASLPRGAAL